MNKGIDELINGVSPLRSRLQAITKDEMTEWNLLMNQSLYLFLSLFALFAQLKLIPFGIRRVDLFMR